MAYDTFGELRQIIDGSDPFMTTGHQILKDRAHVQRQWKTPKWMFDDAAVKKFLLKMFPHADFKSLESINRKSGKLSKRDRYKLRRAQRDRRRAGHWLYVIHLYFRAKLSAGVVASEIRKRDDEARWDTDEPVADSDELFSNTEMTRNRVDRIVHSIRKASVGERTDGKPRTGRRVGRPKKIIAGSIPQS